MISMRVSSLLMEFQHKKQQ